MVHKPLARYVKLLVAHEPGMPGTFSPPPRVSDPDIHRDTCVTNVPWCLPGSLTSGFLWSRCLGKCSRHSRRMRISDILRIWFFTYNSNLMEISFFLNVIHGTVPQAIFHSQFKFDGNLILLECTTGSYNVSFVTSLGKIIVIYRD